MRDILRMTREVYHCYMDGEGNLRDKGIGTIAKRNLDKRREEFLKRYVTLIMSTKIVSETTKIYIRSSLPSVASVINHHNQFVSENETINIKTAQSKIDYDTKKLLRFFPDNMLNQVLSNRSCNIVDYEKRLNLAIAEYGKKNKLLDNLLLRLPKVNVQDSLEEEEFKQFLNMIAPYFRKHIKYLEENLPAEGVGYLQYLMSTPETELTGINKERYGLLKLMLE